jgi:hypothetical protein
MVLNEKHTHASALSGEAKRAYCNGVLIEAAARPRASVHRQAQKGAAQ